MLRYIIVMAAKGKEAIQKALAKYETTKQIYDDYNENQTSPVKLGKKYNLSIDKVYEIIYKYKNTELKEFSDVFNDKEFLKASGKDRLRAYKKQILTIMDDVLASELKNRYSVLAQFYSQLRMYEELEMRLDGTILPDKAKGDGAKVVILQNIRGESKETVVQLNADRPQRLSTPAEPGEPTSE